MTEGLELLRDRRLHLRVQVTGVQHRDAAREIDVAPAFDVPQLGIARTLDVHRKLIAEAARECRVASLLQVFVPGHV